MKAVLCGLWFLFFSIVCTFGQSEINSGKLKKIHVTYPDTISITDVFQISFHINGICSDLILPPEFDFYFNVSSPSCETIGENGKYKQIYRYLLKPKMGGDIVIKPARVLSNNKTYYSDTLKFHISKFPDTNIFVKTIIPEKVIRKGEPFTFLYEFYCPKFLWPLEFEFLSELIVPDCDITENDSIKNKVYEKIYNGKVYNTVILSSKIITPKQSGKLVFNPMILNFKLEEKKNLEPLKFEDVLNSNPFEGVQRVEINKEVTTEEIMISILPELKKKIATKVGTSEDKKSKIEIETPDTAITFTVNVPNDIIEKKKVIIEFVLNKGKYCDKECKDFLIIPTNNFEIISKPFKSNSNSIEYKNNIKNETCIEKYSCIFHFNKSGNITIPSAKIVVGENVYYTKPLQIKVFPQI